MGKRSTVKGYWRAQGATEASGSRTPAPAVAVVPVTLAIRGVDATLAAAGILTGYFLPIGAIPLRVEVNSAATGGTGPLLDVGLELGTPDDDGLADGIDITTDVSATMGSGGGVLLGTVLTEQAEITVSDGGGTNATGGTFDMYITYTFDDDGTLNN
ncbi:MAG: hypothetical protein ACYSW3_09130 [Planctomycetota bacterium]|jgi:hypothetical protein